MTRSAPALALAAVLAAACASSESTSPTAAPKGTTVADASAGNGDSGVVLPSPDASAGTDAGAPIDSSAPDTSSGGLALPFFVSDQFAPSGFMGDSQASQSAITLSHDPAVCKLPRQSGAGGDCYSVTWSPTPPDGGASWAGVYWQAPANNWGTKAGKPIPAGATKVTFYAAGAAGGETIQTCAGGINASGPTASLPYGDTFTVKSPSLVLTTTWTQYEISLQGAAYTDVLGGFCWVASAKTPGPVTFYIDDLKWE